MNRQKDTKTRVFVQKIIDDVHQYASDRLSGSIFVNTNDDFYKYSNNELFGYLDVDYAELIEILEDLKNQNIIFQYECLNTKKEEEKNKKGGLESYRTTGFSSERAPKYEECVIKIPDDFLQKAEAYLAGKLSLNEKITSDKIILHFDKTGEIWYAYDKTKNCSMKPKSQIFFIFKYLVDNTGVQETKDIARAVSNAFSVNKTPRQVSVDIGRIKRKISGIKVIKGDELIPENKNGDGYHISSRFEVIEL